MFQNTPPARDEANHLTIIRTASKGRSGGYILSTGMFGLPIHFYGRSIPCTQRKDCPVCEKGNQPRWTGYLPIWLPGNIRPNLLELPTAAAEYVNDYQAKYATLRGKLIAATRPKGRVNSKIKIDITSPSTEGLSLPPVPLVREALCVIWQIDFRNMEESVQKKMECLTRYNSQQELNFGDTST